MTTLAVVAIIHVPQAHGQQLGVIGGINVATLEGSAGAGEPRAGLIAGGYARWGLVGGLSLEPQLLFSMQGGVRVPSVSYKSRSVILDYLAIPVLVRMDLFRFHHSSNSFDVFAGPEIAFLLNSISTITTVSSPNTQYVIHTPLSGMTLLDFDMCVGGGPKFDFGPTKLGIELRYTGGLGRFVPDWSRYGNNVWSIMASVSF